MKAVTTIRDHFVGVNKMVGARHQRPHRVTPRWGLEYLIRSLSRGEAPGYRVDAPLARNSLRTKGAKLYSLGQRPGFDAPPFSPSPERAKPNTDAHQ
jgi:hypothetical protein